MNERIRELAEQAEKLKRDEVSYRERLHNRYYTGDMEEEIFREKFAELIVQECINVASKYDAPKMSGPGLVIGSMIAEHFGDSE